MSHTQPKTILTSTRTIQSIPTTVSLQAFADRILVIITQIGKIGNLIQVSVPSTGSLLPTSSLFLPNVDNNESTSNATNLDSDEPSDFIPTPSASTTILHLMGSATSQQHQTLHDLYASQIATLIWIMSERRLNGGGGINGHAMMFDAGMDRKPVVVGVGLKKEPGSTWDEERERTMFRGVATFVVDILSGQTA